MKINATRFFTLLFVSALFFFSAQQTFACSCMAPNPDIPLKKLVTDSRENATAVFSAQVISVSEAGADQTIDHQVKVKITKTYKGVVSGEIIIFTEANSAMCGYDFEAGKTYLIYAYTGQGNKLSVNNCSRTSMVNKDSKKELAILKKIKK
jgi:hypothetical protein